MAEETQFLIFFFQAEDGIRDDLVTGVQTCALPISSATETSIPGVHMPHWAAPWRRKAFCRRSKIGARVGRPSTVVMAWPSTWATATRQEQTGSPSIRTVHAPQSPASQPTLVPVRPRFSRSTRERRCSGLVMTETSRSLTCSFSWHLVSEGGATVATYRFPTHALIARITSILATHRR